MTRKVEFIFCGGCNPCIDRLELRDKILQELERQDWKLIEQKEDAQLTIIINGCPTACIRDREGTLMSIVIAGESVNSYPIKGKFICKSVSDLISL